MTLVPIVDEQDKVIGHKERAEALMSDLRRIAALWLTNSMGEILIAKRALTKPWSAGLWGFAVTGAVEKDETYEETIRREAEEELGLSDLSLELGPKFISHAKDGHSFYCQYFLATKDVSLEDLRLDPTEVAMVQWISRDDLLNELELHPQDFLLDGRGWREWINDGKPF